MILEMLKSKIHRATVTQAELNYVGSITIDESLMEAAGIYENEKALKIFSYFSVKFRYIITSFVV